MSLLRNYVPALKYGAKIMPNEIANGGLNTTGNVYYVVPSTETFYSQFLSDNLISYADGTVSVYNTFKAAYDACTSNRGDIIVLAGNSTHSVATGFEMTKNRITVIGMGTGRFIQQAAKVQNVTADTTAYVIKNSGNRNAFINIKFIQISTNAAALSVFTDGGEGTYFENCSFIFGVVDNLDGTTAHEFVGGTDSGTFKNCTFGCETLLTSAARSVFHIDQVTASQEFKSNYMENCRFIISSSSNTATFIRLDAVGDILYTNEFKNTSFLASVDSAGGAALAEAVQTGTGTVKGSLLFTGTLSAMNCTKVSTATSGRNTAIQIAAPATSATGAIGITPTA